MVKKIKRNLLNPLLVAGKQKVFGIGLNKTGTTSLREAMKEFNYTIGNQREAELLTKEWARRDFKNIVSYCRKAEFFQDAPFSKPYLYVVLDHEFPGSKFILTVRDSPDQWYSSITRFHAKLWGKDGRIPTKEDLQQADYLYKGSPWDFNRMTFNTPEDDPYNEEILKKYYLRYIEEVREYFRFRPQDLLVLNVSDKDAYQKLAAFLGKKVAMEKSFPWKNKTNLIK